MGRRMTDASSKANPRIVLVFEICVRVESVLKMESLMDFLLDRIMEDKDMRI